jgi:hypothetical protein
MLESGDAVRHIVHRSKAVRRVVCFLDVSSLNLAALRGAATFLACVQDQPRRPVGIFYGARDFMVHCKKTLHPLFGIPRLCIAATWFAALSASWTFPP